MAHPVIQSPDAGDEIDRESEFIDNMVAKYGANDDKPSDDAESDDDSESDSSGTDGKSGKDDVEDESTTETDDSAEEHPEAGTSADDSDGNAAESEKDSEEDDPTEHPAGDKPEDSSEGNDADEGAEAAAKPDDEVEEEAEEEAEFSKEFEEEAKRLKIAVTLEDVPDGPARQLVKQKLKGMDAAFTQRMQEFTGFRAERVKYEAEETFRRENPALAIAEVLAAVPEDQIGDLIDQINARRDQLIDPTQKKDVEIVVQKRRDDAKAAVEAKISDSERVVTRFQHVVSFGQSLAKKANLPWEFAERAIALAIREKSGDTPDLSDEEVVAVVKDEATNYNRHVRAHRREASRKTIQDRTQVTKVIPGTKAPAAAASPKPGGKKEKPVNYDSEESRIEAGMRTARRLFKGAKDD